MAPYLALLRFLKCNLWQSNNSRWVVNIRNITWKANIMRNVLITNPWQLSRVTPHNEEDVKTNKRFLLVDSVLTWYGIKTGHIRIELMCRLANAYIKTKTVWTSFQQRLAIPKCHNYYEVQARLHEKWTGKLGIHACARRKPTPGNKAA